MCVFLGVAVPWCPLVRSLYDAVVQAIRQGSPDVIKTPDVIERAITYLSNPRSDTSSTASFDGPQSAIAIGMWGGALTGVCLRPST